MGKYPKKLFDILVGKVGSEQGVYSAIRRKEKNFKAIKSETLFYLVAAENNIKISKYTDDEKILTKVDELMQRQGNNLIKKDNNLVQEQTNSKKEEIDPFLLPLSKFEIYDDLSKECKIKKPYSKEINHAVLTLEEFMRERMDLPSSTYGMDLVKEAKSKGILKGSTDGESQGLYFLFASAILWLRNSGGHKKRSATKDECFKIIMHIDYLIKLFDSLCNKFLKG